MRDVLWEFNNYKGEWISKNGRVWKRPLIQNDKTLVYRLFCDNDDGSVDYNDYTRYGYVIVDGKSQFDNANNIVAVYGQVPTEAVEEALLPVTEPAQEYKYTELKGSIIVEEADVSGTYDDRRSASHRRFDEIVDATIDNIRSLATLKGGEYAGDLDRLANFRRNGTTLDVPMEIVWAVYANKHHDAIMQYIKDINSDTSRPRSEPISGRVDDLIVYLILFKLMEEERANAKNS